MRFAVVGDCLLDITVVPAGAILPNADAPARIELGPGGQAANVAVRLARRGATVRLVAPVARDAAGTLLREALGGDAVELVELSAERSGAVVALIENGERTMLSHRAAFSGSVADELASAVADAGWIHCSGYALLDPRGPEVAATLGRRPVEALLSVGGSAVPAEAATRFRELLALARPNLLVLNRAEAASLGPGFSTVVTDRDGSSASVGALELRVEATPVAVVDATGAGDAYAAALIGNLSQGAWPPGADELRGAMGAAGQLAGLVAGALGAQARVEGEDQAIVRR